jgi:hypothetical protein
MILINSLTNSADQMVTFVLADGSTLQLEFVYRAGIQRWCLNVIHPALTLNGYNIKQGANILRPWRNVIPFGILIQSLDGVDPILVTDFQTGRILVYILDAAEVQQVEQLVFAPPALVNP